MLCLRVANHCMLMRGAVQSEGQAIRCAHAGQPAWLWVHTGAHTRTNTHTQQLVQESVNHERSFDKLVERGTPTARPPGYKLRSTHVFFLLSWSERGERGVWPKSMCVWREIALLQLAQTRLGPHDELHT
jgi:hypothetical protein